MEIILNILSMDGYGFYIWTSVSITLIILGANFWHASARLRRLQINLKEQ